jgi:hypothetical protein
MPISAATTSDKAVLLSSQRLAGGSFTIIDWR